MTQYQLLETLFYGSIVTLAVIATWQGESKRQVGLVLFGCWVVSNVVFWTLHYTYRPAIFPILDALFGLTCAKAWWETGSRVPIPLIALSVIAVTDSFAFSLSGIISGGQTWEQLHRYEVSLNIIFVLQCLITGGWGVEDAIRRAARFILRRPVPGAAAEHSSRSASE